MFVVLCDPLAVLPMREVPQSGEAIERTSDNRSSEIRGVGHTLAGVVGSRTADGADIVGYGLVIRGVVDGDYHVLRIII